MSGWILMAGGEEQFLNPEASPRRWSVETLAHQLAQINRFTGAARRPYSVAEHSLLCADLAAEAGCSPAVQLACLMHDAHEAITGDVSTPVKAEVGSAWRVFEAQHARALRRHLGLIEVFREAGEIVHQVDLVALATERRDLLAWDPAAHLPWPVLDAPGEQVQPASVDLMSAGRQRTGWAEWRAQFVDLYRELRRQAGVCPAPEAWEREVVHA